MNEQHKKEVQETSKALAKATQSLISALENIETEKYLIQDHSQEMYDEAQDHAFNNISQNMDQLSIFDRIPDFAIDETLEQKIINLKMTQFTSRRKEDLFKKHKKEQEENICTRKKEAEKSFFPKAPPMKILKEKFTLRNGQLDKTETFPITIEDMDKLRPQADLNDTIVGNYLKMFNFVFLPSNLEEKCFFFSTFFMEKLIGEYVRQDMIFERQMSFLVGIVNQKVKENYKNVARWTKRIDIFMRDYLVFPINAFKHWFCIIILHPGRLLDPNSKEKPQLLYCDSMCEKRQFIVAAVRRYLQLQSQEKQRKTINCNEENLPCYQLLLPRQTNTHDCGLYMLTYIEELLSRPEELENLNIIANRKKLRLFPRTLIFTMRQRLRKLFGRLINAESEQEKNMILAQYKGEKQRIIKEADLTDYDQINQKQYKKYEKMNISFMNGCNQEQKSFMCQIRFYMDPEINFYEKDK